MTTVRFPYNDVPPMEIPGRNLMGIFSPPRVSSGRTEDEILSDALEHPISADPLRHALKGKRSVLVIAEEAPASQSIGSAIAASVMERYFEYLDAPVTRVTSLDIPLPVWRVLERESMVSDEKIFRTTVAAARRTRL